MMSREGIAADNEEVQKELNATKKRGQYKKYTPAQHYILLSEDTALNMEQRNNFQGFGNLKSVTARTSL